MIHRTDAALGGYHHRFSAYRVQWRNRLAGPPRRTDCGTYCRVLLPAEGTAAIETWLLPVVICNKGDEGSEQNKGVKL